MKIEQQIRYKIAQYVENYIYPGVFIHKSRFDVKTPYFVHNSKTNRVLRKFSTYKHQLTIDEAPILAKDGVSLEVKCRYCGKYFIPKTSQVIHRVNALKAVCGVTGECFIYCSDNCKEACPVYKRIKHPKGFKKASSREVNPLIRQLVFERDIWVCQKCGKTTNEVGLHCHHIKSYTQNKILGNDIDNCITLCKDCHKEVHTQDDCKYHELKCQN